MKAGKVRKVFLQHHLSCEAIYISTQASLGQLAAVLVKKALKKVSLYPNEALNKASHSVQYVARIKAVRTGLKSKSNGVMINET